MGVQPYVNMSDFAKPYQLSDGAKDLVKHEWSDLQPSGSASESRSEGTQENRNGQFHRSFSPRQIHASFN